jgi:hypothetical protein
LYDAMSALCLQETLISPHSLSLNYITKELAYQSSDASLLRRTTDRWPLQLRNAKMPENLQLACKNESFSTQGGKRTVSQAVTMQVVFVKGYENLKLVKHSKVR